MSVIESHMNLDLDKLKPNNVVLLVLLLVTLFVPGNLILYLFKKDVYFSLDSYRLSLLILGMTAPLVVINFALSAFVVAKLEGDKGGNEQEDVNHRIATCSLASSIFSLLVLFVAIMGAWVTRLSMSGVVWTLVGLQGLVILMVYCWAGYFNERVRKNKKRAKMAEAERVV